MPTAPEIPIVLDLDATLFARAGRSGSDRIAERIATAVDEFVSEFGLAGRAAVEVREVESEKPVRVRVHGLLQPYQDTLLQRVRALLMPADPSRLEADRNLGAAEARIQALLDNASGEIGQELVVAYVAEVAAAVIRDRAPCLLGPGDVRSFLAGDFSATDLPEPVLREVISSLLALGVSLRGQDALEAILASGAALRAPPEDLAEMSYSRLRSPRLEIHAEPNYLRGLLGGFAVQEPISVHAEELPQPVRDIFRIVVDALFYDLGLEVPQVVWVAAPTMPPLALAIKVNDSLTSPLPAAAIGELLVNAQVETLTQRNIAARAATNPATGAACAVVDIAHQAELEQASFIVSSPVIFAALTFYGEMRRQMPRLLGVEDVEYLLSQIETNAPELVAAVSETFSSGDLARVLRGLLREGVSIRNLRGILERLLQFDAVLVDTMETIVFDDRLVVLTGTPPEEVKRWSSYRDFVRSGLKAQITNAAARGQSGLPVLLIDPVVEARFQGLPPQKAAWTQSSALTESEAEAFTGNVRKQLEKTPAPCALLSNQFSRAALRELLAAELPQLPVIAYSELTPEISLQPVGRAGI